MSRATRFDFKALGRLKAGQMNKTEAAYAAHLEGLQKRGMILWYRFEGIKLRLADKTFYTCDFAVMNSACVIEMHEVKGFMTDDANVKIKVAADQYPFQFYIIKKSKFFWNKIPVSNRVPEIKSEPSQCQKQG